LCTSFGIRVARDSRHRDKASCGVFVRFRAPLQPGGTLICDCCTPPDFVNRDFRAIRVSVAWHQVRAASRTRCSRKPRPCSAEHLELKGCVAQTLDSSQIPQWPVSTAPARLQSSTRTSDGVSRVDHSSWHQRQPPHLPDASSRVIAGATATVALRAGDVTKDAGSNEYTRADFAPIARSQCSLPRQTGFYATLELY
jgi:hypothetical protein